VRWRADDAEFVRELNLRRKQLWDQPADLLRALVPRALEVLGAALQSESEHSRIRAASEILKIASVGPVREAMSLPEPPPECMKGLPPLDPYQRDLTRRILQGVIDTRNEEPCSTAPVQSQRHGSEPAPAVEKPAPAPARPKRVIADVRELFGDADAQRRRLLRF
jgi:hypothetical protein